MSAEDGHGWCYSEGMSGNCGIYCKVFDSECQIQAEICQHYTAYELIEAGHEDFLIENYDKYMDYFIENLKEYIGEFRYNVLEKQTKFKFDKEAEVRKLFAKKTGE